MIFVVGLEKLFQKKGWTASIDIVGVEGKTLRVSREKLNPFLVKQLLGNQEIVANIREMGFKTLIMAGGKITWYIDLKN